jgi:mannose/fructose/N-acetylgalactosamine-specific phosphotransferase system component IIB
MEPVTTPEVEALNVGQVHLHEQSHQIRRGIYVSRETAEASLRIESAAADSLPLFITRDSSLPA